MRRWRAVAVALSVLAPLCAVAASGLAPVGAAPNPAKAGVFRPSSGRMFLKTSNTSGVADIEFSYGVAGDKAIAGDWNGDGSDTIGVFRNGVFYLRNSDTSGAADITRAFGLPGDEPIVGDWNNDGIDSVGVYRNGLFLLSNDNAMVAYQFALGVAGDRPLAGDWNNDGSDGVGVFRPSDGHIFLKNALSAGFGDVDIVFGLPGDKPLAGDWNADGTDTIGVYRNGLVLLRNSNTTGVADAQFALGVAGDEPISGYWQVPSAGLACIVELHGKGGSGQSSYTDSSGIRRIFPTGNAPGWGGRQWLYWPESNYQAARGVVAVALATEGCGRAIIYGFSNGAAFAAKLYCRAETFGISIVGHVVDDPVVDEAVLGCSPNAGTKVVLYWTFSIDRPDGWRCSEGDWTCENDRAIGIVRYQASLGKTLTPSPHTSHQPHGNPPEFASWWT